MRHFGRAIALFTACAALAASTSAPAAGDAAALAGMWGAGDTLLALDAEGGRLQTGCLLVRLSPVRPDASGRFAQDAQAEPIKVMLPDDDDDGASKPSPAKVSGRISGGTMDLTLDVAGQASRQLHLLLGQHGKQERCL